MSDILILNLLLSNYLIELFAFYISSLADYERRIVWQRIVYQNYRLVRRVKAIG